MHEILAALFRSIVHMLVAVRPFVYVSTTEIHLNARKKIVDLEASIDLFWPPRGSRVESWHVNYEDDGQSSATLICRKICHLYDLKPDRHQLH